MMMCARHRDQLLLLSELWYLARPAEIVSQINLVDQSCSNGTSRQCHLGDDMRLPEPVTNEQGELVARIDIEFLLTADDLACALALHWQFHQDPAITFGPSQVHVMVRTVLREGGGNVRYRLLDESDAYTREEKAARLARAQDVVNDIYFDGRIKWADKKRKKVTPRWSRVIARSDSTDTASGITTAPIESSVSTRLPTGLPS